MPFTDIAIGRCIVDLLEGRSPSSSICPSDVARGLCDDEAVWRGLMPRVREVARRMAADGIIRVTQGDNEVTIDPQLRGPIRLKRGDRFP